MQMMEGSIFYKKFSERGNMNAKAKVFDPL